AAATYPHAGSVNSPSSVIRTSYVCVANLWMRCCGSRLRSLTWTGPVRRRQTFDQEYQNPTSGQVSDYPFLRSVGAGRLSGARGGPPRSTGAQPSDMLSSDSSATRHGRGSMGIDRIGIVTVMAAGLLAVALPPALAQEGSPRDGTWRGEGGEAATHVVIVMSGDGERINGMINPGPRALDFASAQLEPATWTVRIEAVDPDGGPIEIE